MTETSVDILVRPPVFLEPAKRREVLQESHEILACENKGRSYKRRVFLQEYPMIAYLLLRRIYAIFPWVLCTSIHSLERTVVQKWQWLVAGVRRRLTVVAGVSVLFADSTVVTIFRGVLRGPKFDPKIHRQTSLLEFSDNFVF